VEPVACARSELGTSRGSDVATRVGTGGRLAFGSATDDDGINGSADG
jgi:hypothetical protein